jgi:serralysin
MLMPSPLTSSGTTLFAASGVTTIDPLLSNDHQKWGGITGTGASLTFSFPWTENPTAFWQTNYSNCSEPTATSHSGLNLTQMTAASNAFQTWANVADVTFTQVPETETNVGDFRIAFSSAVSDSNNNTWGWGWYPSKYWACAADIWINPSHAAVTEDWSVRSHNFYSLIHEIGHGLGLKHPGNYSGSEPGPYLPENLDFRTYSVMSYKDLNPFFLDTTTVPRKYITVVPETPMVYDILAIQYLYGANKNYHTGNDTYSFDPSVPFYKTIWDAGGSDSIDISNFATDCTIDLTEGHYSSIHYVNTGNGPDLYDGSNNLGIAFGVTIETVFGGSGNDSIIGNTVNNMLFGTGGNDTFTGAGGDDYLDGGAGSDTVIFAGNQSDYLIAPSNAGFSIKDNAGNDGTDFVVMVEYLQFSTSTLKLSEFQFIAPMVHNGASIDPVRYTGPATAAGSDSILFQFLGDANGELLQGTSYNDFINVLAGDDGVNAGTGNDVIDGGLGSNFLTGGAGCDIFFCDGRGGGITWSTITDWQTGEQLSIWGWKEGISRIIKWIENGAEGYKGITMHADLNGDGTIDTSVTFTGITAQSQLPEPLAFTDPELLWFT